MTLTLCDPVILWIDWLSLTSVVSLIFSASLYQCAEIRYFNATRSGLRLMRLLCKVIRLRCPVSQARWSLGDMRDEQGRSLRYSIEEITASILQAIRKEVLEQSSFLSRCPLDTFPKSWVLKFFSNSLYHKVRFSVQCVAVVRCYQRMETPTTGARSGQHLVWLRSSVFGRYIIESPFMDNVRVKQYSRLARFIDPLGVLRRELILFIRAVIGSLRGGIRPGNIAHRDKPRVSKAVVGVEYNWEADTRKRSDVYWWPRSEIPPERVLFYFDRPDRKLSREIADQLEAVGFQWVLRSEASCDLPGEAVWQLPLGLASDLTKAQIGLLMQALPNWRITQLGRRIWLFATALQLLRISYYWCAFFRAHNIAVHMNHSGDVGNLHLAQSLGMHLAGGINVRSTYSYSSFPVANSAREYHAFFPWGASPQCDQSASGNDAILCRVIVGYIFDQFFDSAPTAAQLLRHELKRHGAEFAIAVFDEAFGDDFHYSCEMVKRFYAGLVELLLAESSIGFLIKPKKLNYINLSALVPGIETAVATGRCKILRPSHMPCEAAAAADVAIGFGINSAGIEAALLGIPVLYWSPTGIICRQLEGNVNSKLVFHDLSELLASIVAMKNHTPGDQVPGDHSAIIAEIDPWRDGQAGKRVGDYIRWFLEALHAGQSREAALAFANDQYAARWGSDKVTVRHVS